MLQEQSRLGGNRWRSRTIRSHFPPEKSPWRQTTLYSIAGWFSNEAGGDETDLAEQAIAFGGYLKVSEDGSFSGMLIDTFGQSEITGVLTENTLTINKIYFGRHRSFEPMIDYNLCCSENGCWLGHYVMPGYYTGPINQVFCQILPVHKNAFGIIAGRPRYDIDEGS